MDLNTGRYDTRELTLDAKADVNNFINKTLEQEVRIKFWEEDAVFKTSVIEITHRGFVGSSLTNDSLRLQSRHLFKNVKENQD